MVRAQCPGQNKDGNPCSAQVTPGREWCVWHDPVRAAEREEARRRGGHNRATKARARRVLAQSRGMTDVQARLLLAYEQVHEGELDHAIGTAMATIARALVAVQGAAQLEDRLDELQRQITALKGTG